MESVLYGRACSGLYPSAVIQVPWHEGDLIRKLRRAAGNLTLEQVAEKSGVDATTIHDIEVGRTKTPQRVTIQKIALAFGLTQREFEDLVPTQPVRFDPKVFQRVGNPIKRVAAKKGSA